MRTLHFVFPVLLIIACSACNAATEEASVTDAARSLNSQSKSSLGVSIRALDFLNDATPGTFLAAGGISANNSWAFLEELERAGYAKINKIPSGDGEMVQIELTPKGKELLDALHGP